MDAADILNVICVPTLGRVVAQLCLRCSIFSDPASQGPGRPATGVTHQKGIDKEARCSHRVPSICLGAHGCRRSSDKLLPAGRWRESRGLRADRRCGSTALPPSDFTPGVAPCRSVGPGAACSVDTRKHLLSSVATVVRYAVCGADQRHSIQGAT